MWLHQPRRQRLTEDPKHLVPTRHLRPENAVHVRHPLNPNSKVFVHRLSDRVGMLRAHLSLARVPPGKESFILHSHSLQEEFLFILDGDGLATIGDQQVPVGAGDYLGFPTDGTAHHLVNVGERDLVYLMGGERTAVEVGHFPSLGKVAVSQAGVVQLFDQATAQDLSARAWIADEDERS
jgi:uncharacterized cupin superfamily protein